MKTAKKPPTRTRIISPAADPVADMSTEKQQGLARQRVLAWLTRIMGEIDLVRESIQTGTYQKRDGVLSDNEQHKLGCALDHVWSQLADAIPKASPVELAEVLAEAEARDRVT